MALDDVEQELSESIREQLRRRKAQQDALDAEEKQGGPGFLARLALGFGAGYAGNEKRTYDGGRIVDDVYDSNSKSNELSKDRRLKALSGTDDTLKLLVDQYRAKKAAEEAREAKRVALSQQAAERKEKADLAAQKAAQERRLPPDKVLSVNEGNLIPSQLDDIESTINEKKDSFGPWSGRVSSLNPYDETAKTIDSQLRASSQAFGRLMEGGVLRKEDEDKYRKMFPQLSDTPQVALNKLSIVRRLLTDKQSSNVAALKAQGYSTAGVDRGFQKSDLPTVLSLGGGSKDLIPDAMASNKEPMVRVNPKTGKTVIKVPGGWQEID